MVERLQIELDFFVIYSSASAFGNIGQASYSAANTFVDNFAGYIANVVRKRCLSVNWGAIQVGELERNKAAIKKVEDSGYGLMDPHQGRVEVLLFNS